jgi:hypothetical protein
VGEQEVRVDKGGPNLQAIIGFSMEMRIIVKN